MLSKTTIATCKAIQKQYGTSYSFATAFFSKQQQIATHILYAFFRIPDEIVDNPSSSLVPEALRTLPDERTRLEAWKQQWLDTVHHKYAGHPVLVATAEIHEQYHIPIEYSVSFLDAMIRDTYDTRYTTYEELESYMYGSAACVGLMMTHVIGFSDKKAFDPAAALGYAMQLTNFLRDIGEDIDERNRIYLPEAEMVQLGVTEAQLHEKRVDDDFVAFMKHQIARARALYREADKGIPLLHVRGRLAVKLAARLYEAILDEIEIQQYDVFSKRARTSRLKKILILIKTIWKK